MNLLEILQGQLNQDTLGKISEHIGAEPQQTATAANDIFASLIGGLSNNASTEGGLSTLASVLDRDHDGSILDDVMGMVTGAASSNQASPATNGAGILGHILGDKQTQVAEHVSQSSGLNLGQIAKLMPILAPIVMSVLGKAKSQGNLGLGDLAGILMGGAQQAQQSSGIGGLLGSVLGGVFGGGQPAAPQQSSPQASDLLGSVLKGIFKG
jgi:hypothetical protein